MRRITWPVVAALLGAACSSSDSAPSPNVSAADSVPAACAGIAVDRFKELAIVDEAVVASPRASNATRGAWSFAHVIEQITPPGMTSSALVFGWLDTWTRTNRVNGFRVEARPLVTRQIVCPWLKQTPANHCDDLCDHCDAKELDITRAPMRLIGLANRLDLRETEDLGGAGEGRLVFTMTNGPGDDPASPPLAGTVIFEFKLPIADGSSAKTWAERWHALGTHPAFDEAYLADLQVMTDTWMARGAVPSGVGGSGLNQLRVNEHEFDWQWDLREYKLAASGLIVSATRNSPDASVFNSDPLRTWMLANREAILTKHYDTPDSLTGGQSQPLFAIRAPTGIDEPLRKALAEETCAGCHQLEHPSVDVNFHYSPFKKGTEKLSPFLNAGGDNDELAHRSRSLRRALCGT